MGVRERKVEEERRRQIWSDIGKVGRGERGGDRNRERKRLIVCV